MTILEKGPWNVISAAQATASNVALDDPSAIIAIHLCNQKGVDPYGWAGNALTNWQFEIYTALLQRAIV